MEFTQIVYIWDFSCTINLEKIRLSLIFVYYVFLILILRLFHNFNSIFNNTLYLWSDTYMFKNFTIYI